MLSRIMNIDPLVEMKSMEDTFNRLFAYPTSSLDRNMQVATLPVDIFEQDNNLIVRAAVPGVKPEDLDVSIENNILTIKGEIKSQFETNQKETKVYRREVSYGAFSRSIRLPDSLQFDKADAEFTHGFVTITIPKIVEAKPQPRKLNVRAGDQTSTKPIESNDQAVNTNTNGQTAENKASVK